MTLLGKVISLGIVAMVGLYMGCSVSNGDDPGPDPITDAVIINHTTITLSDIPTNLIDQAKQKLHIAYGYTSHGSQIATGMDGLVLWEHGGSKYAYNNGGTGGALDFRTFYGLGGNPLGANGVFAHDLGADDNGNLSYTAWEAATRAYLATDPGVNVIIWAWCWQVNTSSANITTYLTLMSGLEQDFPSIKFVYMTGRTNGTGLTGNDYLRNKQIRDYCTTNNKILYDFFDIESYDPDGTYFVDKLVNEACDYDSNGDGTRDRNWAIDWQNAHPGEWYNCSSAHSQPLNANMKAYAAWWLWARLAGWAGK